MGSLHKVTHKELPLLVEWLSKHLPDTYKLYGVVYEEIGGRWQGPTCYTLGWPNILAVDESNCKARLFGSAEAAVRPTTTEIRISLRHCLIMGSLHKVMQEELPVLLEWLSKHLPDTYKIYGVVYEELRGRWQGTTYYTLGWPNILAVGEGPVDESKCKCADFFNNTRHTCVYAPNPEHAEELLVSPGFLDWTKPILFHAVAFETANVIERVSKATGTPYKARYSCALLAAYPGDIVSRPVPDEFDIRPLNPDNAEYVTSTWPFRRQYTEQYLSEVVKTFPSVGIFNRNGDCVACEIGSEFRFSALLHVREEYRGRGLAAIVVSHLAQKYFEENKPILAAVLKNNKPAMVMHTKLGFKPIGNVCWYVHSMAGEKVVACQE